VWKHGVGSFISMEPPIALEMEVFPKGQKILVSIKLNFNYMNNVTEYEACIVGLQVAMEFSAYDLSIFVDSLLIISQIEGKWQA